MNCPNCNKEISPDWELCPFCRYVPKKCSNTTHAPRWLPQEAKFCPECGNSLTKKDQEKVLSSQKTDSVSEKSLCEYGKDVVVKIGKASFKMIYVKGGTFLMGYQGVGDVDKLLSKAPVHKVKVSDFYMSETQVTQALWKTVMNENPSDFKGNNLPVDNVSWFDCQDFISRLNDRTGREFRLPTEAEWEYAARGGKHHKNYDYSGSDILNEVGWYGLGNGKYKDGNSKKRTHWVKRKNPNAIGLYDMSGNVSEWCEDWYYKALSFVDPIEPSKETRRVARGGNAFDKMLFCKVFYRRGFTPSFTHGMGCRLVMSI